MQFVKRRTVLSWLAAVGAGLAITACLAPTLPLPPPEAPDNIQPAAAAGQWQIAGGCTDGAIVLVKNERTGAIVGFEDDQYVGRYRVELAAERCDPAVVLEIVGDDATSGASFQIREIVGGVPQDDCPSDAP